MGSRPSWPITGWGSRTGSPEGTVSRLTRGCSAWVPRSAWPCRSDSSIWPRRGRSRRGTFFLAAGRSRAAGRDAVVETTASLVYSFDEMTVANSSATARDGGGSAAASVQRGLPIGDGLGYVVQGESGASEHFGAQLQA